MIRENIILPLLTKCFRGPDENGFEARIWPAGRSLGAPGTILTPLIWYIFIKDVMLVLIKITYCNIHLTLNQCW